MRLSADLALSHNLAANERLMSVFRDADREALMVRLLLWFSGTLVTLAIIQLTHHALDLPGLHFIWQMILSICS